MATMMQVIEAVSALNHGAYVTEIDTLTIDKHDNMLYIYVQCNMKGTMFQLDKLTKVLHDLGVSFYLSSTRYDFPAVVVRF